MYFGFGKKIELIKKITVIWTIAEKLETVNLKTDVCETVFFFYWKILVDHQTLKRKKIPKKNIHICGWKMNNATFHDH